MSTSTATPIGSLIPATPTASSSSTRSPHGGAGSGAASSSRSGTNAKLPSVQPVEVEQLKTSSVLTPSARALLDRWHQATVPMKPEVGTDELTQLRTALTEGIAIIDEWLEPGSDTDAAQLILDMAEMMQALVPKEKGLDLFIAAIGELPRILYREASIRLARTYRYPRLPLPADFIAQVAGEILYAHNQRSTLATIRQSVETTINRRTEQERRFR